MTRNAILSGVVLIALLILGAGAWYVLQDDSAGPANAASVTAKAGFTLTPYDRALGSPKAPMLVMEYGAPTCPVCARFDMTVFPQFKKEWIDTGKAYYVFRTFPLSAVDVAAENIARCLPADRYFSFIDLLYRNQAKWDPDGNVIPDVHGALIQMAQLGGLSAAKADSCIQDAAAQKRVADSAKDAEKNYLIDHTPTIFANGHEVDDAKDSYTTFNAALLAAQKK
ncbi:MAG: thioredoxin domain-containing protein [Rhizomicrobium sp.]